VGIISIRYADIRGVSISFAQFLVELFIGAWLGNTTRAVAIARGKDPQLRPLTVFEVRVRRSVDA
jgi:hypothetical protein